MQVDMMTCVQLSHLSHLVMLYTKQLLITLKKSAN